MITALDIITDALVKLGIYAPTETPTAADVNQGLVSLNDMLDQWADEYLYVTQSVATVITLVNGTSSYTIGPGGVINQARPQQITAGPGVANATITAVTTPIDVVTGLEWRNIYSVAPGSGTPNILYYDPQYPLGILHLAPTPASVGTVTFGAWLPLTEFPDEGTEFTLVPGMDDSLKTNLAVALKPYFATAQIDPLVVMQAMRGKSMLRYTNLASRSMIGRVAGGAPQAAAR